MGKLIRCITSDGAVMISAVDTTDIVEEARKTHDTTAVVTAALGRLLTAGTIMGNMMKGDENSLTLRVKADGPAGSLVVVSDPGGNVKGYVENPHVTIPPKTNGKLDVGGAVGTNGHLYVLKDVGLKEPYSGIVPLVTGEIAEDITSYYATSEQIPTVCALGVLVNGDRSVACAGGFIMQLLPGADDSTIDKIEENIGKLKPVTTMLAENKTIKDIVDAALEGFEVEVLYTEDVAYKCDCSRERVMKALVTLGPDELKKMADEMPEIELNCHFCNKNYKFTPKEVRALAKN